MAVQPIPDGFHSVTPYLILKGAAHAIDFYKRAFGATEVMRLSGPGDSIMHAEIKIGNSIVMMADEFPEMGFSAPQPGSNTPVGMMIYVEDVDAQFSRALAAGATVKRPLMDQFYGDRSGTITDPFGHTWTLSTHTEDLTPEEIQRRFEEAMKQHA